MKNESKQRGAIIVEASLALPFFMFAIYILLSVVQIAYTQARVAVALDSTAKQMAEYSHVYFALGLDEVTSGGGASSELANNVAQFLEEMSEGVGNISSEAGQFLDSSGKALEGDNLTAWLLNMMGGEVGRQILKSNLSDGAGDTYEAFIQRNRIEDLNMKGSQYLNPQKTNSGQSSGKDIFLRVNYKIRVVELLGFKYTFQLSHCAYAQAWAGD